MFLINRKILLCVSQKTGKMCNSNDVNYLRKTKNRSRNKKKTFDSYKKSFQDISQKERKKLKTHEIRSYKSKKYTQSYDSNQFNFKFKRRKKNEANKKTDNSPKKINIIHDGCT